MLSVLHSSVNVLTVAYPYNEHKDDFLLDLVEHPVIPHTNRIDIPMFPL